MDLHRLERPDRDRSLRPDRADSHRVDLDGHLG
jgi:hypothetical protein